jgi:CDK-activating kinase assembly factor MAT1
MVMNLVFKTDVKKTEAMLNKYREANTELIKANAAIERNAAAAKQNRQTHEKDHSHPRRQAAQKDNLTAGARIDSDDNGPVSDPTGLVKGLRRIRVPPPERVYDAFLGMTTMRNYYELRADYPSERLPKAKNDTRTKAGGFDFQAYFDESLLRAYAGLGCFIDEEKAGQDEAA